MRTIFIVCIVSVFTVLLFSCGSNNSVSDTSKTAATAPTSPAPIVANAGQMLFEQKCGTCHGNDGMAGIGGAASLPASKLDSSAILQTIDKGKNAMPSFSNQLTQQEMKNITSYVMILRK